MVRYKETHIEQYFKTMKLKDTLKNLILFNNKYRTHSEAIIIACYFNPQRNPYRLKAFRTWYESIKHLNHRIVECVVEGSKPELVDEFPTLNIHRVFTKNLLWHKESLLNGIVSNLEEEYKYVFWLDTDVTFTNKNWLVDSVKVLQTNKLVQPFEFCVHMEQDELTPSFDYERYKASASIPQTRHPKVWRSFGYNHVLGLSKDQNYDKHGHVGFAWGARREVLDTVPLYDKALVGGADHIIAHAGAGHIGHSCITKSFTDDLESVNQWSKRFYLAVQGKIGYVQGDLFHIWHGDIAKRQYLKRIQDFTPETKKITQKDKNGLYITDDDSYVKKYFDEREVKTIVPVGKSAHGKTTNVKKVSQAEYDTRRANLVTQYPDRDDSFIESLMWGYITDSTIMGSVMGGNIMGAMIGDALNTSDEIPVEFGGGEGGGAGSGGSWDENQNNDNVQSDTTDYTTSSNFS